MIIEPPNRPAQPSNVIPFATHAARQMMPSVEKPSFFAVGPQLRKAAERTVREAMTWHDARAARALRAEVWTRLAHFAAAGWSNESSTLAPEEPVRRFKNARAQAMVFRAAFEIASRRDCETGEPTSEVRSMNIQKQLLQKAAGTAMLEDARRFHGGGESRFLNSVDETIEFYDVVGRDEIARVDQRLRRGTGPNSWRHDREDVR